MTKQYLETVFPEFLEIQSQELRSCSEAAMLLAVEKGGWSEETLGLCPVTLNWLNCDVCWITHVKEVTAACLAQYEIVKNHFETHKVDFSRDMMLAGALLHDIGKLTEFVCRDGKAVHGDNFELMRHPLSGAILAAMAGCPDKLTHLIAVHSFEGERSYQTPESSFVRTIDIQVFNNEVAGLPRINH